MKFTVELSRENDGRWICDIPRFRAVLARDGTEEEKVGVLAYGESAEEAALNAVKLLFRVIRGEFNSGDGSPPEPPAV